MIPSRESYVTLDMVTFRPLEDSAEANLFFQLLDDMGGIFTPEIIESEAGGKSRRVRYQPGNHRSLEEIWPLGFVLLRQRSTGISGGVTIWPDRVQGKVPPNYVIFWFPGEYFDPVDRLSEVLEFGNRLYEFLSPCYGFVSLPWQPTLRGVWDPQRGLPGWGWATWLGPEYEDLVSLPTLDGVMVRRMSDGGRGVICGWPKTIQGVDPEVAEKCERILRLADHEVFQRQDKEARRVPRFRYVTERQVVERSEAADEVAVLKGNYGPIGFTRTSQIRAILDPLEPDFLGSGVPNGTGGAFYFFGLTPQNARRLLGLLPPGQAHDSLESSPTFRTLVELGEQFPQIRLIGYRIPPGDGECITLEGFFVAEDQVTPELISNARNFEPSPEEIGWELRDGVRFLLVKWA